MKRKFKEEDQEDKIYKKEQKLTDQKRIWDVLEKLRDIYHCMFNHYLDKYIIWEDFLKNLKTNKYIKKFDGISCKPYGIIIKTEDCILLFNINR